MTENEKARLPGDCQSKPKYILEKMVLGEWHRQGTFYSVSSLVRAANYLGLQLGIECRVREVDE